MSADVLTTASATGSDPMLRIGRWVVMKVWLGCVLSGAYSLGNHFGWPQIVLTLAATFGALLLGTASLALPHWTVDHYKYGVGILPVDIGMRVVVWLGLTACVVCVLLAWPAVAAPAGGLWMTTVVRTFGPGVRSFWSRRRARR